MHLIVIIAIGVFGGLWLFVKWGEWREARWERRELKRQARAEREEIERIQAMMAQPPPPPAEPVPPKRAPAMPPHPDWYGKKQPDWEMRLYSSGLGILLFALWYFFH